MISLEDKLAFSAPEGRRWEGGKSGKRGRWLLVALLLPKLILGNRGCNWNFNFFQELRNCSIFPSSFFIKSTNDIYEIKESNK